MSKPQVLVDGTVFEGLGRIGIWRLFYETMSRTATEVDYTLLLSSDPAQPLPEGVDVVRFSRGPELVSRRHVLWNLSNPLRQSRLRARFPKHIWHPTFFSLDPRGIPTESSDASVDQNGFGKRLVTVYDMLSEDFYWMGDFALQREMKKRCLRQSDHAIAISSSTQERLLKYFPSLVGKTDVIHLAADHTGNFRPSPAPASTETNSLADRYCLFVGGRDLYKHFEFVVRAMASDDWPDALKLYVIGRPLSDAETDFIRAHGVENKLRLLTSVTDSQLNDYYRNASCFVFPSIGEGFGLPVLESQQNRCVPVLSDMAVFREVGGDGAVYYSPHEIDSFVAAITSTLDEANRERLLAAGAANVRRFSWDECAKETLDCYRRLWDSSQEQTNR